MAVRFEHLGVNGKKDTGEKEKTDLSQFFLADLKTIERERKKLAAGKMISFRCNEQWRKDT